MVTLYLFSKYLTIDSSEKQGCEEFYTGRFYSLIEVDLLTDTDFHCGSLCFDHYHQLYSCLRYFVTTTEVHN